MKEEFYDYLYKNIYAYIKRKLWFGLDVLNIDEIVNKSIYEFIKKWDYYKNCDDVLGICCMFAYNIMRNSYVYKMRYYNRNVVLEDYYYYRINEPLDLLIRKERKMILKKGINSLDYKEKTCIIMYYYRHISYEKIAIYLNVTYYKVRKIINHALIKLKIFFNNISYEFN